MMKATGENLAYSNSWSKMIHSIGLGFSSMIAGQYSSSTPLYPPRTTNPWTLGEVTITEPLNLRRVESCMYKSMMNNDIHFLKN